MPALTARSVRALRNAALPMAAAVLSACAASAVVASPPAGSSKPPAATASPPAAASATSPPASASSPPAAASPPASASIPQALLSEARPIGTGARFTLAATGPVTGSCESALGRRFGVHVEVFAANRVLLLPAGIGLRGPSAELDGAIVKARCYGALVTLDPTGLVLVRPGSRLTLADLFRAWGQPLSDQRLTSFAATGGSQVSVYVDGRRWNAAPTSVPLTRHAEIVLEVGPHVPPHSSYAFPPVPDLGR